MSPDLSEIWAYGCPKSPTCGSQSDCEVRSEVSDNEDEDENAPFLPCAKVVERKWSVMDGAPCSYISSFLDLSDTFCMRNVAPSWNIAASTLPLRRIPVFYMMPAWQKYLLGS